MANRFFPNYPGYLVTSSFGMRTLRGITGMHNGIDLVAKTAQGGGAVDAITAHTGGEVIAAGYDPSAGYFLKIRTAPNVTMVYYHLREQSSLSVGDPVRSGQVIGFMGATGNVTGAHLHFGIRVDGTWIDPAPWLDRDVEAKTQLKTVSIPVPVLFRGLKTPEVRPLQVLLNYHLDADLEIDGSFGPATEAAVEKFQRKYALETDKRVGPATWTALLAARGCPEGQQKITDERRDNT